MDRTREVLIIVFGFVTLLILLLATSRMSPWTGWSDGTMGPGMMVGWGFLGWVLMLLTAILLLTALVLGVIWLRRQVRQPPAGGDSSGGTVPCPNCGQLVQEGWTACPYCSQPLVTETPPPVPDIPDINGPPSTS